MNLIIIGFNEKINNKNCYYFFSFYENNICGSIRFDKTDCGYKISYLIDKEFHRMGFGKIILRFGVMHLKNKIKKKLEVYGDVHNDNIASIKIFQSLLYKRLNLNESEIRFKKNNYMKIGSFDFIKENKVFIIAELSANHNGSFQIALETIRAAKRAGANCIKLQTYTADTLTIDSAKDDFIIKDTIWNGQNLYKLYDKAYTPWDWHQKLFQVAKEEGFNLFLFTI